MGVDVIERGGFRIEPQSQWVPSGRGVRKGWRPKAVVREAGNPGLEYVIAPRDVETLPTKDEADAFMLHWAERWLGAPEPFPHPEVVTRRRRSPPAR